MTTELPPCPLCGVEPRGKYPGQIIQHGPDCPFANRTSGKHWTRLANLIQRGLESEWYADHGLGPMTRAEVQEKMKAGGE